MDDIDTLALVYRRGVLSGDMEPIRQLLMEGRRDRSGDFTHGAALSLRTTKLILYAVEKLPEESGVDLAAYARWCRILFADEAWQKTEAARIRETIRSVGIFPPTL